MDVSRELPQTPLMEDIESRLVAFMRNQPDDRDFGYCTAENVEAFLAEAVETGHKSALMEMCRRWLLRPPNTTRFDVPAPSYETMLSSAWERVSEWAVAFEMWDLEEDIRRCLKQVDDQFTDEWVSRQVREHLSEALRQISRDRGR